MVLSTALLSNLVLATAKDSTAPGDRSDATVEWKDAVKRERPQLGIQQGSSPEILM